MSMMEAQYLMAGGLIKSDGEIMTFIGRNLAAIGQIIPHGQILRDNGLFRRVIGQIMTFIGRNVESIGQIIPYGQILRDNGLFRIVIGQNMPFYRLKTAAIGQIGWIIGQEHVKNGRQTKAEAHNYGEHLHSQNSP